MSEVAQLCPTLCNPMDCSLPSSSVHGIFQAIVLEWIAISFSRGSSRPRDRTWTLYCLSHQGSPNVYHYFCLISICIIYVYIDGEADGTPLQYSCLGNPMGRGAWWAAVHGVAKSQTRLSDFTFTFHFHAWEKEMATHSSVLAWRIPGKVEPGGLPSMGLHRVRHD